MTSDTTSKIQFMANHIPALTDGDYEITVTQNIKGSDFDETFSTDTIYFSVQGPRFRLNPQEIQSVFPPPGSLGDHANVLPHMVLNRSTLPWERKVDHGTGDTPWLALLLFAEDEVPTPTTVSLSGLEPIDGTKFPTIYPKGTDSPTVLPHLVLEYGDHEDDHISVIDVPAEILQTIMPTKSELTWLAHVRQPKDDADTPTDDEFAVIIGNRLPQAGAMSTVHLVSLEGLYSDDSDQFWYQDESADSYIRLVSLKSWQFSCVTPDHSFQGLLHGLDLATLHLPTDGLTGDAQSRLSQGYTPLAHAMRQGNKSVSWYHGPLLPGAATPPSGISLPIRTVDQLLLYQDTYGMFDVSYAAAWELGRLLALQSRSFSINLYNWKRRHAQALKTTEQTITHPFGNSTTVPDLPPSVSDWFAQLALLEGVPFNYLVPDEAMVPQESIRFFQLDSLWVECLLDGAFSIGRVSAADQSHDGAHDTNPAANPHGIVSGCLLRSQVVSGWPHLLVEGYDSVIELDQDITSEGITPLTLLRMERLSPNVLLCLFEGEAHTVDFHLKAEKLHFGVDINEDQIDTLAYVKRLRDEQGTLTDQTVDIPWRNNNQERRVLDVDTLAITKIGSNNAAEFALQMIEGTPKIRFTKEVTTL